MLKSTFLAERSSHSNSPSKSSAVWLAGAQREASVLYFLKSNSRISCFF